MNADESRAAQREAKICALAEKIFILAKAADLNAPAPFTAQRCLHAAEQFVIECEERSK